MTLRNQQLFELSQRYIPGGVNSPVRAFKSVGGEPVFFQRGEGAYFWDSDGKPYVDYVGSWGPLILGHAHPDVVKAVQVAAQNGLTFGAPTEAELEIAQLICQLLPSIEQVRLVSSGTEAGMSVIRLARGFTGRSKIIKFEGCYHGQPYYCLGLQRYRGCRTSIQSVGQRNCCRDCRTSCRQYEFNCT